MAEKMAWKALLVILFSFFLVSGMRPVLAQETNPAGSEGKKTETLPAKVANRADTRLFLNSLPVSDTVFSER